MKKKEAENVQETAAKSKKKIDLPSSPQRIRQSRAPGTKPLKVADDPRFSQAVQNYEAGLKALQSHKYDKAKACLRKGGRRSRAPNCADRAAVHLNTCNQQLNRDSTNFKTPEEQFDYAVSLMNMGDYVSAREIFEDVSPRKHPKLDFVWYGAAALNCLMGHFPDAITGLNEAIRLNPANRFQARNDSDFKSLADDPRFTELLYPDTSAEVSVRRPKVALLAACQSGHAELHQFRRSAPDESRRHGRRHGTLHAAARPETARDPGRRGIRSTGYFPSSPSCRPSSR